MHTKYSLIIYCAHQILITGNLSLILDVLRYYQVHEAVCKYVKVSCVHSKCGELVSRAKLAEHLEQACQYRMVTCECCQTPVVFADIKVSSRREVKKKKKSKKRKTTIH